MSRNYLRAPPAFQEYAADLLANEHYRLMSLAERGLLHNLRLHAWVFGSFPTDLALVAQLIGTSTEDVRASFTPRVSAFFENSGADRLVCPELVKQRARMEERRAERTTSGKKGAKAKWSKEKRAMAEPMAEPSSCAMASVEESRTDSSKTEPRKASLERVSSIPLTPESKGWADDYERSAAAYEKASRG